MKPFEPIVPFEPIMSDNLPSGEQWVAQVKWDGVRILTYFDGNEVRLYNRKLHERTMQYPELLDIRKYCQAKSIILDGEMIALDNGKPSFCEVMKRDGIRKAINVERAQKKTPITYMIFDVLYCNGEWTTQEPLHHRVKRLEQFIIPTEEFQVVQSLAITDADALFAIMGAEGMEGIICKDLTSTYLIGGKDNRWIKKKCFRDLIAVVGGVTYRNGIVNSLLLGLFDESGKLWYIGHAGTGKITQAEWRALTEGIKPLIVKEKPFVNQPERAKQTTWLTPHLTVKVQYINWPSGHSLRQPSIQGFVGVPATECRIDKQE